MNEVNIHGISVDGDGVGRLDDGRVVFVENAVPGDHVRIELAETRKRVQYANLLQVVEPSEERVTSRCTVARCGGCALRTISGPLQGRLKRQTVADAMRRIGGLDVEEMLPNVAQFGDGWSNRHRVRLHSAYMNNQWRIGYYERRSRRLVPLVSCPVAWPEVERLGLALGRALEELPQEAMLHDIDLAYSRRDGRGAARITTRGPLAAMRRSLDWLERTELSGIEVQAMDGRFRHGNLELRYDHRRAEEFDLRFEPGLFTQAYVEANDALVEAVLSAVRPRGEPRVLELHAGIGNFTVPLARSGAKIVAYERNRRAAILCQRNGRAPGMEIDVRPVADVEALAATPDPDVVLMDPPRTGARPVVEALAKSAVPLVVYVSCDPATLARDAALLHAGGYGLKQIQAFDMFPQTPHVETMAVFERT